MDFCLSVMMNIRVSSQWAINTAYPPPTTISSVDVRKTNSQDLLQRLLHKSVRGLNEMRHAKSILSSNKPLTYTPHSYSIRVEHDVPWRRSDCLSGVHSHAQRPHGVLSPSCLCHVKLCGDVDLPTMFLKCWHRFYSWLKYLYCWFKMVFNASLD